MMAYRDGVFPVPKNGGIVNKRKKGSSHQTVFIPNSLLPPSLLIRPSSPVTSRLRPLLPQPAPKRSKHSKTESISGGSSDQDGKRKCPRKGSLPPSLLIRPSSPVPSRLRSLLPQPSPKRNKHSEKESMLGGSSDQDGKESVRERMSDPET